MQQTVVTSLPIGGKEIGDGETLSVRAPWDDQVIGVVPMVRAAEVTKAIDAAARAMETPLPAHERGLILERAAALVRERRERLAHELALEVGKPITGALAEIDRAVQTLTFCAGAARTLAGTGVALDAHPAGVGRFGFTIRVPLGVVAAITPFNFPFNLAAHKVGPAIAAGCAVVLKPASKAPLAGLALARILHEAGLPKEWLSVVIGAPEELAGVMLDDPRVAMITFTGSAQVGWTLAARAPRKRVALELGNSTPVIVCADADLEAAALAVATSGYGFAGQSCISAQRVLVQQQVHDRFLDRLVGAAKRQKLGDPLLPDTTLSALIDRPARDKVSEWVDEAVRSGGEQVAAGTGPNGHLLPVVVDRMPTSARAWKREIFGPVVGVHPFESLDEAIALANDTEYGLQAGIFTSDLNVAFRALRALRFGGITINESPSFRVDQMPYGGTKESGNTKEGPEYTIREMTEERMVVFRT